MSRFWSAATHELVPYVPGEQPKLAGLIKLNTNECPYGPSPRALQAIREAASDTLRLYPDPESTALRDAIARHHRVERSQVFVGNGSDEVLAHAFQGLLKHDAPLLFPDITYSFYPVYCGLYGIAFETVALDDDFRVRPEDYRRPCGAIIIANPNAPTGIALSLGEIETILRDHPDQPVVIDEAYVDFGADSAVSLVGRYPNLLVVHTLSKSRALAGLRVGYAVGDAALIEALVRVKDSFNSYPLDRLAEAGASASIEDDSWFHETTARIIRSRETLVDGLERLGFLVLPSAANFVLARHPDRDGASLQRRLRENNVLVRHFNTPRIADHLRITIGTDAECDTLLERLGTILRANRD
ncbi:histidinol-phosphate transaminase [Acetobacteraceae bacterium KSS8]|uniref:Histidinol-phosphate aminotransferase n=1 Tax=Endosaccharibacter trunci TaxID=2812733 RepID=A0ABT1W5P0_9PROT|nr:histidinol-phosphate transaminase [Acetobacteraceae bacterium KSS8]